MLLAQPGQRDEGEQNETTRCAPEEPDGPVRRLSGPGNQVVASVFLSQVLRVGAGNPMLGPLPVGF
jgi:hypothetical protein